MLGATSINVVNSQELENIFPATRTSRGRTTIELYALALVILSNNPQVFPMIPSHCFPLLR